MSDQSTSDRDLSFNSNNEAILTESTNVAHSLESDWESQINNTNSGWGINNTSNKNSGWGTNITSNGGSACKQNFPYVYHPFNDLILG